MRNTAVSWYKSSMGLGSMSKDKFIDHNQFKRDVFAVGDTIRSYKRGFGNDKPYKNHFIEGVVVETKTWVTPNDHLIVKWQFENYFGAIYKVRLPHNGQDTFGISARTLWLQKMNKCGQLALAF